MQSNKASKKNPKIVEETSAAPAKHRRKTGSPAPAEPSKVENTQPAKAVAAAAGTGSTSSEVVSARQVSQQEIAQLAHSYWVARGYAGGSAEEDWLRAERELTSKS
ncbi:MAG: DUF2934 domain-containing protein [Bryobacteraceae bacterium]